MKLCGAATFSGLLILVEDDEQVPRALGAEGQHDGLQDGRQDGQGQQQGPQIVGAQDRLQAENLEQNKNTFNLLREHLVPPSMAGVRSLLTLKVQQVDLQGLHVTSHIIFFILIVTVVACIY